jgi:hypothetical protein
VTSAASSEEHRVAPTPEQRRKNVRLGLILLTVAIAFGLGFVAKAVLFGV